MSWATGLPRRGARRALLIARNAAFRARRAWGLLLRDVRIALVGAGLPMQKQFLILDASDDGLFSQANAVLGLLEHYDSNRGCYAGLRVDFRRGPYADPVLADNWWNRYFLPIELGSAQGAAVRRLSEFERTLYANRTESSMPAPTGAALVAQYIRAKPDVSAAIDALAASAFEGTFTIGVHYRGTDKASEAPPVPYEAVGGAIRNALAASAAPVRRIFVATDEAGFLDYARRTFPAQVICMEATRSVDTTPVHLRPGNGHRKGLEAVLDCFALSRCDSLIRTESNLGRFASFLAPDLPVLLLGARDDRSYLSSLAARIRNRLVYMCREAWLVSGRRLELLCRVARLRIVATGLPLRKERLLLNSATYDPGMFSQFSSVLGLLEHYAQWEDGYAGIHVDLDRRGSGLYFEPAFGDNWWEYFFEPVAIGPSAHAPTVRISDRLQEYFAYRVEQDLPRQAAAGLIRRFVRVKAHVRAKVDEFVSREFGGGFVLGIHYRGTDKHSEVPLVPYERVRQAVIAVIRAREPDPVKLFLATDDLRFLGYLRDAFPANLVYREITRASGDCPLDMLAGSNYLKGEEALIDCLLLSRCSHLVRTASNLSLVATMFSPDLPVTFLSEIGADR